MTFLRFLKQLFSHWSTGMTGVLSLPFAFGAAWMPSLPQKALFATMTVVCLTYAFYKVWQIEAKRVEELEDKLRQTRPLLIPEVQQPSEYGEPLRLLMTNIGQLPALNVRIKKIEAIGKIAEFETVQVLRPEDGRIEVKTRFVQANDLRAVLGSVHLVAALRFQREGKTGKDFVVPLLLTYADPMQRTYEETTFGFAWIPSVTGIPAETEMIIRPLLAGEGLAAPCSVEYGEDATVLAM
jgi:hypothetical protein